MKRIVYKNSTRSEAVKVLNEMLREMDLSKSWVVSIDELKKRRTSSQNAFLWVCYSEMLRAAPEQLGGFTEDDLHQYFLGKKFGVEHLDGLEGGYSRPRKRSSNLNKQEFSDYLEFLSAEAANLGIIIPEPRGAADL